MSSLVFSFHLCVLFPAKRRRVYFPERDTISPYTQLRSIFLFLKVKYRSYIEAMETRNEKQGLQFVGSASYHSKFPCSLGLSTAHQCREAELTAPTPAQGGQAPHPLCLQPFTNVPKQAAETPNLFLFLYLLLKQHWTRQAGLSAVVTSWEKDDTDNADR